MSTNICNGKNILDTVFFKLIINYSHILKKNTKLLINKNKIFKIKQKKKFLNISNLKNIIYKFNFRILYNLFGILNMKN
jgi:hypothetical protein